MGERRKKGEPCMFVVYMYRDQQSRGSVREKEEGDRVTNVGMASSLPAEHPFRSPAKPHVREYPCLCLQVGGFTYAHVNQGASNRSANSS